MTGCAFCSPIANTTPAARGSNNFRTILLYMANGAKSHPCSSAPRWYVPVPALPGITKILRALAACANVFVYRRTEDCILTSIKKTDIPIYHFSISQLPILHKLPGDDIFIPPPGTYTVIIKLSGKFCKNHSRSFNILNPSVMS